MKNIRILSVFILLLFSLLLFELPKVVIDFLVLANIIFSVVILIKSLLSSKISEIFSFPSLIVLASLFRLCVIICIAKLLLSYGELGSDVAGRLVESFGSYASGADPIVGFVIFLIIGLVNLLVISKGALRVAEVSARFTLDAIPGKQSAIDSDLRANLISPDQASAKRKELNRESQFYASIDGAMKWVQGDALFTFVVSLVCFVVGIALGYYRGLNFQDSLSTFGVLSIGAGLVNIIPSLLISVSSGLLVSKVESDEFSDSLEEILNQIFSDKKIILSVFILTTALFIFSLFGVISMPFLPFLLFSILSAFFYYSDQSAKIFSRASSKLVSLENENKLTNQKSIGFNGIRVELGEKISHYLEQAKNFDSLNDSIEELKLNHKKKYGIELPDIKIVSSKSLEQGEFKVVNSDSLIHRDALDTGLCFLNCSNSVASSLGYKVLSNAIHDINKNQISSIRDSEIDYDSLKKISISVYKPYNILANKIIASVSSELSTSFGISDSKKLIRSLPKDVTEELFKEEKLSLAEYNEIIKTLVREGVSVSNLKLISESAIEYMALNEYDEDRKYYLEKMYSFIRKRLSKEILNQCISHGDKLRVLLLSPELEQEFKNSIEISDSDRLIKPVNFSSDADIRQSFLKVAKPILDRGSTPIVVLCSSEIRASVQSYLSQVVSAIVRTLAYDELSSQVKPEIVGTLNLT